MLKLVVCLLFSLMVLPISASAGEADVVEAKATQAKDGTFRFDVTVRHEDTGWEHYADGWHVLDMDGNELGYRKLLHPHVNEQPFTRSLSGIKIPDNIRKVQIRANDSLHGTGDRVFEVTLPGR